MWKYSLVQTKISPDIFGVNCELLLQITLYYGIANVEGTNKSKVQK